jgi:AcrR family transcriptional regulator
VADRGEGELQRRSIAPIYRRLPRGPHSLGANEVARHQRLRMHGAMVEAVSISGYEGTSVKQVIGLAGVSRRSFYEQFANKQECFLATFDLVAGRGVQRLSEAYRSSGGELEDRIRASVAVVAEEVEVNAKGAGLVLVHAPTAGPPGQARLRGMTGTLEQLLTSSFAASREAAKLPSPIVRGIVGGAQEAMSLRLRAGRPQEIAAISEDLVRWTLLFHGRAIERASELLAARARESTAAASAAGARASETATAGGARPRSLVRLLPDPRAGYLAHAEGPSAAWMSAGLHALSPAAVYGVAGPRISERELRARLRASVLNLAVVEDYAELTAPQIAEAAGIPIEAFCELYSSKDECFLAAFDELSDELLQVAADPELVSEDWPRAVRRVLGSLLRLLAERPLYAQAIASQALSAGPESLQRDFALMSDIATLLTEGAPEPARSKLAVEGVAGAIWQTIRGQVASRQIERLPALSDYLAYVVLTPFVGADAAAEIVVEGELQLAA